MRGIKSQKLGYMDTIQWIDYEYSLYRITFIVRIFAVRDIAIIPLIAIDLTEIHHNKSQSSLSADNSSETLVLQLLKR